MDWMECFMARFIALDKTAHRNQGWARPTSYAFAAEVTLAPMLLEEIAHALPSLPLVFSREGEEGPFQLMALLSLQPNLNLFTAPDGRWVAGYIPAFFRAYPFRLLAQPKGKRMAVCFDERSGLLREEPSEGEPRFFDDQGEPSADLARVMAFMEKCEQGRQTTQRAVDALAKHELITPWPLKVDNGAGEPQHIQGLYRIDEQALGALNGRALSDLQKRGALAVAYGQLLAQHRVSSFAKLYELRAKLQAQAATAAAPDMEALFGASGETLNFDFLNR